VYRVYGVQDARPEARPVYRLLATVPANRFRHVASGADGSRWSYVVVAASLSAGEGGWGYGRNADSSPRPR
jgi:hypothetical protein